MWLRWCSFSYNPILKDDGIFLPLYHLPSLVFISIFSLIIYLLFFTVSYGFNCSLNSFFLPSFCFSNFNSLSVYIKKRLKRDSVMPLLSDGVTIQSRLKTPPSAFKKMFKVRITSLLSHLIFLLRYSSLHNYCVFCCYCVLKIMKLIM